MKKRYAVLAVAFLLLASCTDNEPEQVLPDMPVRAVLSLDDAEYTHLQNLGEFLEIKERRGAFTYIGVGGLLIVHLITPMDEARPFAAFDLYCPYCYYRETAVPRPRVKGQAGGLYAVCEKCGSRYDISSGFGGCVEGAGKQLQAYTAAYSFSTRTLTITD